jgi:hypothetical protein
MSVSQPDSTGSALRASLDAALVELRAATARGAGGRGTLERYADRVDGLIRQVFTDAGPYEGPVAVIALGGYGRRHLCLHSDIDLLLLFGNGIGPAEERFVHRFLNPLWDLGVVVGHQVRDIEDFQRLETDNPEFLLALLDARPVAGARSVFERFGAVFHQADTHAFILRSLLALIEERHAKFNDTLYQLEPDVKDAPGALRDLTATRTIALLTDPLLLRRGPADAARFDDAEDFLLEVRSTLHLECGRNQNVLSHELQERTAEMLGFPGAEPGQRVEADERLPPRAHVSRSPNGRVGRRRVPVGPNMTRATISVYRSGAGARSGVAAGHVQAALDGTEVSKKRSHSAARRSVSRGRLSWTRGRAAVVVPEAAAGLPLSRRCTIASLGRVFPGSGDFVARGARLLPQYRRRAHTVDDPEPRAAATTDEPHRVRFRSLIGFRNRAARARAPLSRRGQVARR